MAGVIRVNGLPNVSFPMGSSISDQVNILEQALIDYPEDEAKILNIILPYLSCVQEKYDVCIELADRLLALSEDPTHKAEALLAKASILWERRADIKTAEKLLIEVHAIDPTYQQPYEILCEIYREQKEYTKALHWANLMIQQEDGMDEIGLQITGDILVELNRTDDAIEAYKQVISLNENAATAYYGLGGCYAHQEKFELARDASIAAFEKCHYPESLYAYSAAYCYQCLDDPYRAMQWYNKALDIEPNFPDALNNMAALLLELNNGWDKALPYLLKAVELSGEAINPSMRLIYRNLWAYYSQILDKEKAEYYKRLNLKCTGLDDDSIDFLNMFGNDKE